MGGGGSIYRALAAKVCVVGAREMLQARRQESEFGIAVLMKIGFAMR